MRMYIVHTHIRRESERKGAQNYHIYIYGALKSRRRQEFIYFNSRPAHVSIQSGLNDKFGFCSPLQIDVYTSFAPFDFDL